MNKDRNNFLTEVAAKAIVLGAIALVVCVPFSFRTVRTGEVGIKSRMGKMTGTLINPGLVLKAPFITSIKKFDLRVQKVEVDANAASKDMQDVYAKVAINYHIPEANVLEMFRYIGDDNKLKDRIISPAIQEVIKAVTANYKAEELLRQRAELKIAMDEALQVRLKDYWIEVDDVSIVDLNFSDQFNAAIEAKTVAEQETEKARYEVETAKQEMEKMKLQKENLTPELLQKIALEKWNGQLPSTLCGQNNLILEAFNNGKE